MVKDAFHDQYWNLCQAAVWIEFREKKLVEQFAAPEGQVPDGDAYRALHFYPLMWPPERVLQAKLNEFVDRLKLNSLQALGYHTSEPDRLQVIPPEHWYDIDLRPPLALDARNRTKTLWTAVRVKPADVLRIWPFPSEGHDRSWFDWEALRKLHDEVCAELPDLSARDTILKIQARFQKRFKKKPLGRTSLQNHIKAWKSSAS